MSYRRGVTVAKFDSNQPTIQELFIKTNRPLLAKREQELADLLKQVSPSSDTLKRIAKLQDIVFNIRTNIYLAESAMTLKRPYGG